MDLEHSGIKGQKWGRRRFQYEDGSLTPAGLLRYRKTASDQDLRKGKERLDLENNFLESYKKVYGDTYTKKRKFKKDYKRMTDEEIKSITYRLGLENEYLKAKSTIESDKKELYKQEHRIKGFFKYTVPEKLLSPIAIRVGRYGVEELLGIPHEEKYDQNDPRLRKRLEEEAIRKEKRSEAAAIRKQKRDEEAAIRKQQRDEEKATQKQKEQEAQEKKEAQEKITQTENKAKTEMNKKFVEGYYEMSKSELNNRVDISNSAVKEALKLLSESNTVALPPAKEEEVRRAIYMLTSGK